MKYYISLFMLVCFANFSNAQDGFYKKQWEDVTKLENEGLTKSASETVETIFKRAKKDKNTVQKTKALLHQSKYLLILEEDAQLKVITNFKTEIEISDTVNKRLLQNLLANLYWQYYQQNRYKFYNRTKTEEKVSDDFRTWDLETLFAEIHTYYQRSLQNGLLLQQESLENYEDLLITAKNSKTYRPTLYDLLNHNALQFYKTDENTITQPAYQFKIDNPDFIADSDVFINLNITSKDSVNLQMHALKIYQNLSKFHRKNSASKAFVTIDIERLNFVKQNAVFENKDELLLKSLQTKAKQLSNNEIYGLYQYEIAKLFTEQATQYTTDLDTNNNNTLRWKLKEAITLCNTVVDKYPESDAALKCEILKQEILRPQLNIKAESYLPIDQLSRLLVTYKNLDALDFVIYKVKKAELDAYANIYRYEDKVKFLSKLKVYKSYSSALKNENDYQSHSTEVVFPELENGLYIIKADTKIDGVFATTDVQITNLALVESNEDDQVIYQVIDRNNGNPITKANATVTYYSNRNSNNKRTKNYTTDSFGKFYFKKDKNYYNNVEVDIKSADDKAIFGKTYINRNYKRQQNTSSFFNTYLFTDRSIYRPSQTVYFKGIVTETVLSKTTIFSDKKVSVTLHNVNGEKISELDLKTNDYGSFNGEFILPTDGLTGDFSIQVNSNVIRNSFHYFSVEEYKRPKFETTFKPITKSYKVNDSITVNGNALAFAGSNITDAKVVYRVKRNVQFPSWYYWRRPYYNVEAQEITFGESKTNAKGEFEITFKALPDESVSKENLPVFSYEVTADVTDINGETRSATTTVRVGYHSLTASINAAQRIDKSEKETEITINTANLNGQFVSAKGTIKLYKLNAPNTVLRQRPWPAPDYQVITESEFKNRFPHEAYNNESAIQNWKKGKLVFETDFNTETSKSIVLKRTKNWDSGSYIIVLETEDKFGQAVKDEAYTLLFSTTDKALPDYQLFDISLDKDSYSTNDTAILSFGTSAKNINITIEIEKEGKIIETQIHKLSNTKKTIKLPVTNSDLGGFVVHYSFSAFNAFKSGSVRIYVPYPKTDLQIETSTFRDKLLPGQDETWRFKIKGTKGDKVAAEVLASMYDASLDQFKPHNWSFNPISNPSYYGRSNRNANRSFGTTDFRLYNTFASAPNYPYQGFDRLNWFGLYFGDNWTTQNSGVKYKRILSSEPLMMVEDSESLDEVIVSEARSESIEQELSGEAGGVSINDEKGKEKTSDSKPIQIRKNLQETAFFFPKLQTDKDGNVSFNFKAPEALTKWKLQLLAHTKTLESAVSQFETVTQKELMVIPNAPRFLREGDQIIISTKIANLTEKQLSGKAQLVLTDAVTGKDITSNIILKQANSSPSEKLDRAFVVNAKSNTQVSWTLNIPEGLQAVEYKIIAQSEDFSDGEQNALPVLSNRMLVTETMPMWIRSNQTKTFTLDKLKNTTSTTLKNHKLTLEITSNPAWYAVQALPYLMEYPYDCNEQTFSRYYSNALAQHIVTSNPKIEAVFNQWRTAPNSKEALISNLEKNQELKSLLIQETPWLRDAQSESEQKKRIALLFDLNKMNTELQSSLRKLKNNQHNSGAWPWFNGGRDNRYITQHIVAGFGHLKKLNVNQSTLNTLSDQNKMIEKAINYLDEQFVQEYNDLTKYNSKVDLTKDHLSYTQLHYLYVRSFYPEVSMSKDVKNITAYYQGQIKKYWLSRSLYAKGLMALTMHRASDAATANKILKSLKENSINSEELGMYWKANTNSWYWYQAPIETQALLIEAFSEIGASLYASLSEVEAQKNNLYDIDNLKIWLLKNKQTNQWKTTKATTEAVYALLLQGSNWLAVDDMVAVKVGNETLSATTLKDVKVEAGTGYYKTSWNGTEILPQQAEVTLTKKGNGIAWGALYWQYFEDLDKITSADTPLKLSKKLFKKSNTATGEELSEITSNSELKVGDLVKVRIELRSDRNMEFVHLKDMRAAGFEPVNVLSQYKWQDNLGYYESTKDAATNFFIDYLPKGIYVFEYDLRVNNAGDMSNGISTIQSMYAPEFSSHSEGIRVKIDTQN